MTLAAMSSSHTMGGGHHGSHASSLNTLGNQSMHAASCNVSPTLGAVHPTPGSMGMGFGQLGGLGGASPADNQLTMHSALSVQLG